MSIIHEALKKVEKNNSPNLSAKDKSTTLAGPAKTRLASPFLGLDRFSAAVLAFSLFFVTGYFIFYKVNSLLNSKAKDSPSTTYFYSKMPGGAFSKTTGLSLETPIVLSGIFFSGNEGYCLINNEIVRAGDKVGDSVVKSIRDGEVEMEAQGLTFTLLLEE